jgi:chromosome segregation ATPase
MEQKPSLVIKTTQQKLDELKQEVGKAFFDYGRIKYEIEVKEKDLGNISVNIHNLNHKCITLTAQLEKEAKEKAMEIKLAPPPEPVSAAPPEAPLDMPLELT